MFHWKYVTFLNERNAFENELYEVDYKRTEPENINTVLIPLVVSLFIIFVFTK